MVDYSPVLTRRPDDWLLQQIQASILVGWCLDPQASASLGFQGLGFQWVLVWHVEVLAQGTLRLQCTQLSCTKQAGRTAFPTYGAQHSRGSTPTVAPEPARPQTQTTV